MAGSRFCRWAWSLLASAVVGQAMSAQQPVATNVAPQASALSGRVTINVDTVPLRMVLESIAQQASLSPGYSPDLPALNAKVSLHVQRVPAVEAFEMVLRGTEVSATIQSTGYVIFTRRGGEGAESGGISGLVTDGKTRRPIAGADVLLDDSVKSVHTDEAGRYRLVGISSGPHRVAVRSVGYARQSRMVTVVDDQTTTANFVLQGSVNTLDQVVVTATGEQRVRELGHVVATINADSLVKAAPISSMIDLLQSRVPGLQVLTGSGGVAGGSAALRLRGQTTVSLDPEPIVIVDGVRFATKNLVQSSSGDLGYDNRAPGEERSLLYDLNPNDIATIEVVKGPSASTLYGPDASNGVIVITTKRGAPGKTEFSWYARPIDNDVPTTRMARGYQAWGHDPQTGEPFTSNCTLVYQYKYNVCVLDSITSAPTIVNDPRYSMIAKARPAWQYGANVKGGSSSVRYYLSANYDSQIGAMHVSPALAQYLKNTLGTRGLPDAVRNPNVMHDVSGHANVSTDIGTRGSVSLTTGYTQTDHLRADIYGAVGQVQTFTPGRDTTDVNQWFRAENVLTTTEETSSRLTGALNATYRPWTWLTGTAVLGLDLAPSILHSALPAKEINPYDEGMARDSRRSSVARTMNLGATAVTNPGLLSFRTSAGLQYTYSHQDGLDASAYGLAPGSDLVSTAAHQSVSQQWMETASLGTYGEEVVGLRDQLFVTGSLRVDGSTSFGDAYHPVPYPKIGLSWIASNAPIVRSVPGLSELRFRYSFGAASRYPTSPMKLGSQYGGPVYVEGASQTIFIRNQLGNPTLRPERTREAEYGVDATILSETTVGLTWYTRRTRDQLQYFQNAAGMLPMFGNLGLVAGHGFEATVDATVLNTAVARAGLSIKYAYHTDKLLSLGGAREYKTPYGSLAIGYPLGAVFAGRIIGVADTVGGGPDGIVFPEEIVRDTTRRFRGVMDPPKTLMVTPSVTWLNGRVRLSTTFDRQMDFTIKGNQQGCADAGMCLAAYDKTAPLMAQAMTVTNDDGDFLEPGAFTRWRELTFALDLPQRWLQLDIIHLHFSRASVSVQGRNLKLWTDFKGMDPESRTNPAFNDSQATGLAQSRVWSFRFDVTP